MYDRPNKETDFLDFPEPRTRPDWDEKGETVLCPICLGHGGWNISVNQYSLPMNYSTTPPTKYEDTPENRHRYVHFKAGCSLCNGWGWTSNLCRHSFDRTVSLGNCYRKHHCEKCDQWIYIDSSD